MPLVDFIISNDRHHVDTFAPVIEGLSNDIQVESRILSLCEFRGYPSPARLPEVPGLTTKRLSPPQLRRMAYGTPPKIERERKTASLAKLLAWSCILAPTLRWTWSQRRPSLVVLPNDYAYPYGRIMQMLRRMGIKSLLVQEGIRFPLPGASDEDRWGTGAATAIAAWGPSTARLLHARGVDPASVHQVGAPRFDVIKPVDWEARAASPALTRAHRHLLFVTNPIDHQGFCSTAAKLELVHRFLTAATPFLKAEDIALLIKLHAGESFDEYSAIVASIHADDRVQLVQNQSLYPLLASVDGVIVLGSTVGLEALLFGLPLGVVAIPSVGFVHDYVSAGVAIGIHADELVGAQLAELVATTQRQLSNRDAYLAEHLATRRGATERLNRLIADMLKSPNA